MDFGLRAESSFSKQPELRADPPWERSTTGSLHNRRLVVGSMLWLKIYALT
jgi:hypothetical protein